MSWTVIWLDGPLAELARHYLSSRGGVDPDAITEAMAEVYRELDADPSAVGESRSGNERVVVVNPLAVYFEVYPDHRTAIVTRVCYRQPG